MKKLVTLVAASEAATGVVVLADPAVAVRLMFGAEISGAGIVMSRFAGACLVSLGVACWPSSDARPAARGILVYGLLAAIVLAIAGIRGMAGPLLWPAIALHAILTILLLRVLAVRGTI